MSLLDLIDQKRPEILRIAAKHGARDVRLFGSVARGEEHEGSDVDLLAEIDGGGEDLQRELKRLLRVKVDIVPYSLHPLMRERVLSEAIPLDAPDFRERAVIESQRTHMAVDRDRLRLLLMIEATEAVLEYGSQGREVFDSQRVYRDAIVQQLTQIGEGVSKLSHQLRQKHPEIAWQHWRRFRNDAVHDYPGLVMSDVWQTVQVDIPKLKAQLEKLL